MHHENRRRGPCRVADRALPPFFACRWCRDFRSRLISILRQRLPLNNARQTKQLPHIGDVCTALVFHRQVWWCVSQSNSPLLPTPLFAFLRETTTTTPFFCFHLATQAQTLTTFQPYSKYPPCYKDVTFWLPEETFHNNDLFEVVRDVAGDLVEEVDTIATSQEKRICWLKSSNQARPWVTTRCLTSFKNNTMLLPVLCLATQREASKVHAMYHIHRMLIFRYEHI